MTVMCLFELSMWIGNTFKYTLFYLASKILNFLWSSEYYPKSISFFFVCETGVWIQGFALAKQVLYCLNHTSSPLVLVILEMGVPFYLPSPGLEP
jgi:hypothetical protein